ncbi:MAG: NAD(P)H-hydrate dehydratase [Magnetococcales bacterium]|nr:NAD(P)H-hydrate dehydratase [Magnetococcales bacterium]
MGNGATLGKVEEMTRLLTAAQMREADRRTIEELGLAGLVLMENAGAAVMAVLRDKLKEAVPARVLVLAGPGNNGGDGFVVARRCLQEGVPVQVLLFARGADLKGDAGVNHNVFVKLGGVVREVTGDSPPGGFDGWLLHAGIVVDAVFGTGLKKPVTGLLASLFERVNASGKPVLAVDIPSGVSSDDGQIPGCALKATWTVALAAEKIGHRLYPGAAWCGEVVTVPIGIPQAYLQDPGCRVYRNRPQECPPPIRFAEAHKGSFGHLLVVAGSVGKTGAAILTASGALRVGTGLVTVASPLPAQAIIASGLVEAMTWPLPVEEGLLGEGSAQVLMESGIRATALAAGPGLGVNMAIRETLQSLARFYDVPVLLDADALNVMSDQVLRELVREHAAPVVVTPHPGEMARLLGTQAATIQAARLDWAVRCAADWGCWVVLKGAGTVIASPQGEVWINETGNPGMAAGGSGDVLTGIVGGFLAQGMEVGCAVRLGVWLHGAAGDAAAKKGMAGLLARDLVNAIPKILSKSV